MNDEGGGRIDWRGRAAGGDGRGSSRVNAGGWISGTSQEDSGNRNEIFELMFFASGPQS
jgi:hypothetical protein